MSTFIKKKHVMYTAPLIYSNNRITMGGSWMPMTSLQSSPLDVMRVSTLCLGHVDDVSVVHIYSTIYDNQLKHEIVLSVYDYSARTRDVSSYVPKIQTLLDANLYAVDLIKLLDKHIQ